MEQIEVSPVAGWELQRVEKLGIALLTLRYLVSTMQPLEQALPSKNFGMTPMQLRELARALDSAAQSLENVEPQAPPGPKH